MADTCRYHFQFPNSATWGDKMRINGSEAEQLKFFLIYGTEWEASNLVEREISGKFEIEVRYPYMVWVAAVHERKSVYKGKLKIEFNFIQNT
jgi:hypothetical protein